MLLAPSTPRITEEKARERAAQADVESKGVLTNIDRLLNEFNKLVQPLVERLSKKQSETEFLFGFDLYTVSL